MADLIKKPYSAKELGNRYKIVESTVRKHISLLRSNGNRIFYSSKDKKYYTPQAKKSIEVRERKVKDFLDEWMGAKFNGEEKDQASKKLFEELKKIIEERISEVVLRYLLLNATLNSKCKKSVMTVELGIDEDLMSSTLKNLIKEGILEEQTGLEEPYYSFSSHAGFVRAVNLGLLTPTATDVEALLTIYKGDRIPKGDAYSVEMREHEGKKIMKWTSLGGQEILIPQLVKGFTGAFYDQEMAPIWYYGPKWVSPDRGIWPRSKPERKRHLDYSEMVWLETRYMERFLREIETLSFLGPPLLLWHILDFKENCSKFEVFEAQKKFREAQINYLLSYSRPIYQKLKKDGLKKILEETQGKIKELDGKRRMGPLGNWWNPKTSLKLLGPYLAMLAKIFEYASTIALRIGLDTKYVKNTSEYSIIFKESIKKLGDHTNR